DHRSPRQGRRIRFGKRQSDLSRRSRHRRFQGCREAIGRRGQGGFAETFHPERHLGVDRRLYNHQGALTHPSSPRGQSKMLENIKSPADLRGLSIEQLKLLANEIREVIVRQVANKGGHLASSLGTVELTLALHKVYQTPNDKIIWDTGHQAYPHKLVTGRYCDFHTLKQFGGLSGFLKRDESEYDAFGAGHASTSLSAALGMAAARSQKGEDFDVVAVIGDGAMTGGMVYEALNNAGEIEEKITFILNDNKMSIAKNLGGISKYL